MKHFLLATLFLLPAWAAAQIIIPVADIDVNGATELSSPVNADTLVVYDSTAGANKKVQIGELADLQQWAEANGIAKTGRGQAFDSLLAKVAVIQQSNPLPAQ